MTVLHAHGLVKSFARRRVVDGVSLSVSTGEIVGLLGPNGAGKTTTFRMICGLLRPDAGKVVLSGTDVTNWPMFERARNGGMGYLPQQSSVFSRLTVRQNLLAIMQLLRMDRNAQRRRCDQLLEQFRITHLARSRAGSLSGGERRRLEIARCLVSDPEIIMLDEPFAGIDPVTVQGIQDVIRELAETGISILITDHAAREILQIADRTYVVSEGRILCSGTTAEIIRHDEVKQKYLGELDLIAGRDDASVSPAPDSALAARTAAENTGATRRTPERESPNSDPVRPVPPTRQPDAPRRDIPENEPERPRGSLLKIRRPRVAAPPPVDPEITAPFSAQDLER